MNDQEKKVSMHNALEIQVKEIDKTMSSVSISSLLKSKTSEHKAPLLTIGAKIIALMDEYYGSNLLDDTQLRGRILEVLPKLDNNSRSSPLPDPSSEELLTMENLYISVQKDMCKRISSVTIDVYNDEEKEDYARTNIRLAVMINVISRLQTILLDMTGIKASGSIA